MADNETKKNEKKQKIVLIVDDEQDIRESIKLALEDEEYEVFTAADGEEGYNMVQDVEPDLMILDVMMPKMNGYEVCKKVRGDLNSKALPVLMLTVKNSKLDKMMGFNVGVNEYMVKPFGLWELLARVKILLDPRHADEGKK